MQEARHGAAASRPPPGVATDPQRIRAISGTGIVLIGIYI
jgi:hypothetical protein